jgi:hypothetical protein
LILETFANQNWWKVWWHQWSRFLWFIITKFHILSLSQWDNSVSDDEKDDSLESIQFLYTSSYDQQSNIKSEIHGNYRFKPENTQTFILNNDERIYKVRGQITDKLYKH